MIMKLLKEVLFAGNEFLSHLIFPLTERNFQREIFPLIERKNFQSKVYIVNLTDSLSIRSDRSQSAVAPLLTDFVVT